MDFRNFMHIKWQVFFFWLLANAVKSDAEKFNVLWILENKTVIAMAQTNMNCYTGSIALGNHVLSRCPSISNSFTAGNVHSRRYSNSYYFRTCTTHFPKRLTKSNMNRNIFRRCCLGTIWIAKDSGLSHYIVFYCAFKRHHFFRCCLGTILIANEFGLSRYIVFHFCFKRHILFFHDVIEIWCFSEVKTLAIIITSGNDM